ncbi:hypothetical protein JAAARDRAFT_29819 [Jaapia argillacea MUCL 33604]|uniref:DUF1764-domain-containing protein n=1 Tax=Jaapia argillacea MUCL 33604 TaxID=933084 RepID=A0A067Q9X6_9AGAM|nr:hypothetical protein JAAARDRAFT_29819 [Jaapia argillacea MUCL 33604]
MPKSEIDDIFAGAGKAKGKAKVVEPVASSSSSAGVEAKKRKKKDGGAATTIDVDESKSPDAQSKQSKKRPAPETIVDPSSRLVAVASAKRSKLEKAADSFEVAKKRKVKQDSKEAEDRFKDSRGSGHRRKTEEGFSVYKEDELGITEQGGDTPLCPFDCQCCF